MLRLCPLLAPALVLAACVSYRAQPISPVRTAAAFEERSLADVGKGKSWNLDKLTSAAWRLHPDLDVARAQLGLARAALITAGERPNPTLTLSPQFAAPITPLTNGTYGIDLDVPIETAGKRGKRLAQARAQADSARFSVASTLWQVRSRLRKNLVDLFAAAKRVELLRGQQGSQDEIVRLSEQQVEAGELARTQLAQSRLLANQARLMLAEAEKQSAEARAGVADAVGVSTRALDAVTLDLGEFEKIRPAKDAAMLRRHALFNRADILGALADYAAAEAALRLEIAKQYPDVHFAPGYAFDQGVNKWTIGLSMTLPVFNQNRGAIAEAEARRAETGAKFLALQARVIGELERALAGYRGAVAKLDVADSLLTAQEKQQQTAQTLFKAGETDRLALVAAQVERDSTALSRLEALIEAQQALGALEDAAQTALR